VQAARGASLTSDAPEPDRTSDEPPATGAETAPGPADGTTAPPAAPRRTGLLLGLAALALTLDVVTKSLVVARLEGGEPLELLGGRLLLRVSRNPGAAFSFAEGATVLFTAVAVVVVVVILRVSRRLRSVAWALSLGLLLGGASGNLVDRLLRAPGPGRGAVVDFIDVGFWPSFNVADSAIVTGALLAVLLSMRGVEIDASARGRAEPS
jgi:signal peptidase II